MPISMEKKEPTIEELRDALYSSSWEIINKYFKRHLDKRFNRIKKDFEHYKDWQSVDKYYREVIGEIETKVKNI